MKDFAEQFVSTIKKDNITPLPRWFFTSQRVSLWALGAMTVVGGAAAIATMIHVVRTNDWDIYQELSTSLGQFVVTTIPYAWIFIVSVLLYAAYLLFARTPHGYRYRIAAVTGGGLIISSLLGSVMYAAGVGEHVDEYIRAQAPAMHIILNPHAKTWQNPEKGRLAGDVIASTPASLSVKDERGTIWTIETGNNSDRLTFMSSTAPARVRLFGILSGSTTFKAHRVLPDTTKKHAENKKDAPKKARQKELYEDKKTVQPQDRKDQKNDSKNTTPDESATSSTKKSPPSPNAKPTSTFRFRLKNRFFLKDELKKIMHRDNSSH